MSIGSILVIFSFPNITIVIRINRLIFFPLCFFTEEDLPPVDTGSGDGSGDDSIEPEGSGGGHHRNHDTDDTEDGVDDYEDGHIPQTPKYPVSTNDESNVIPKSTEDLITRSGTNVYPSNSSPDFRSQITLMKAVASFLFPICVVWLGGILSDWL